MLKKNEETLTRIKKEYFSIPNLMGYFRILMIPVFLYLYGKADSKREYLWAFVILGISLLTDFFDGKIARKYHMVTDFGKVLDPAADKLTQGALALAVLHNYPIMDIFLILFLIKELYMAVMGLYLKKKKNIWNGAQWYGKICTAVVDIGLFILLLFPGLSYGLAHILVDIMIICIIFSLVKYVHYHFSFLGKNRRKKRCIPWKMCSIFIIGYLLLGAILPYLHQPEVGTDYKENFEPSQFYAENSSCDRAAVIEDNGEALAERLCMIDHAKHRIILSTFDFRSDTSGRQMLAALKEAAERGVQVQIVIDGFNFLLRAKWNPYFRAVANMENVEFRIYNPLNLFTPWKAMSRMHDKYVIADEEVYLLGGRNTFDYFLGNQNGHKNYDRDILVYNTGGRESSIYQVIDYFQEIWNQSECKPWKPDKRSMNSSQVIKASDELKSIYDTMKDEHAEWFQPSDYVKKTVSVNKITLISNSTELYSKEPQVFYSLYRLMENAKESVVVHTPYIMCNDMMYRSFHHISRQGVPLTIMTNSSKNNGNPFGAVDYVLHKEDILDTGVDILEYEGGISYHGKSVVIDDNMAIIGSFNMDMKSVYQDTELMLAVNSKELCSQLTGNLEIYHKDASLAVMDKNEWKNLLQCQTSVKGRLQRRLIMFLDPWVRFLM